MALQNNQKLVSDTQFPKVSEQNYFLNNPIPVKNAKSAHVMVLIVKKNVFVHLYIKKAMQILLMAISFYTALKGIIFYTIQNE